MIKFHSIFTLLLFYCINILAQDNNDATFANKLFQEKNYQFSILEYERLLFKASSDTSVYFWNYQIGECKFNLHQYQSAMEHYTQVPETHPLFQSSRYKASTCALRLQNPTLAKSLLRNTQSNRAKFIMAYCDYKLNNSSHAINILKEIHSKDPKDSLSLKLSIVIDSLNNVKPLIVAPAALLSIVPGLGHVYSRRYGDGLSSAILVTTSALVSGYYAYHNAPVRAAVFGSISGVFYAGSIYGALVSVRIANQQTQSRFVSKIELLFDSAFQ